MQNIELRNWLEFMNFLADINKRESSAMHDENINCQNYDRF